MCLTSAHIVDRRVTGIAEGTGRLARQLVGVGETRTFCASSDTAASGEGVHGTGCP